MYFLADLGWFPAKFTIPKSIFVLFGRFWVVVRRAPTKIEYLSKQKHLFFDRNFSIQPSFKGASITHVRK